MPNRLPLALLFWLFLAFASSARAVEAINFKFTDTAGKIHRLSELKGKWVLVNFWAPWCPPCWKELPDLDDLQKQRDDIVVIGIAMDYKNVDSVQYLLKKHNVTFPIVMGGKSRGEGNPINQVGPVPFYPTSFLYAPDNQMVMVKMGMVDQDIINHFIYDYNQDNNLKKLN